MGTKVRRQKEIYTRHHVVFEICFQTIKDLSRNSKRTEIRFGIKS